jgi:hypothetical protein
MVRALQAGTRPAAYGRMGSRYRRLVMFLTDSASKCYFYIHSVNGTDPPCVDLRGAALPGDDAH